MTECPVCSCELESGRCWNETCPYLDGDGSVSHNSGVVSYFFDHWDDPDLSDWPEFAGDSGCAVSLDRPVCPPDGWSKNPDCDLHGLVDMISRPDPVACIDVWSRDDGLFTVALNPGLYDNTTPEDYDHIVVSPGRVQRAVDLLAHRWDREADQL